MSSGHGRLDYLRAKVLLGLMGHPFMRLLLLQIKILLKSFKSMQEERFIVSLVAQSESRFIGGSYVAEKHFCF